MFYTEKDIDFTKITPKEFENLCYEMVIANDFQNVIWRQGGADNGRDIEASLPFNAPFINGRFTRWFFECKHYTNGVPAEDLQSKIAWADAENPDFLVLFTTSYITTSAKQWLEKIQPQKKYAILIVEGQEIKTRLTTIQHLIPKYFSEDKYLTLYQDIVRHYQLYRINPSMPLLMEIIPNIPAERFELKDIGFLLYTYYDCMDEEERNGFESDGWSDTVKKLPGNLLGQLKKVSSQTDLTSYFKDFDFLEGVGFIEEAEIERTTNKNYQTYWLHLNLSNQEKWQSGKYVIVVTNKQEAFELLMPSSESMETYSYYYTGLTEKRLEQIFSKYLRPEQIAELKTYAASVF